MTQAVIYCRFSPRPGAAECESIITQLDRCRSFCAAKGWEIEHECQDENLSGKSQDGREGLADALSLACRRGRVLVVYALSRLARKTRDALEIAERLDKSGADLAVLDLSIDTTSATGRFTFTLLAALAQLEREQISERTSDAMRRRQSDGQQMSKHPPYGKKPGPEVDGKRTWVNCPAELAAIKRIQELHAKGWTPTEIAEKLQADGAPCRGSKWRRDLVARIIERSSTCSS